MSSFMRALFVLYASVTCARGQVQTVPPQPLAKVVTLRQKPVESGELRVPVITLSDRSELLKYS